MIDGVLNFILLYVSIYIYIFLGGGGAFLITRRVSYNHLISDKRKWNDCSIFTRVFHHRPQASSEI